MRINKLNYFTHRKNHLSKKDDRYYLGKREIDTLTNLIEISEPHFFIHSNSIERKHVLFGKYVVDIGCGDQHIKKPLEENGGIYKGIDINECDLENNNIPLRKDTYDIAVCLALIEHLQDPALLLSEVKRILKPGGFFLLSSPNIVACGFSFWDDPTHIHPYSRKSLKSLLLMHGFVNPKIVPNYRCKPKYMYKENKFAFFRAKWLMPFSGSSNVPVPKFLKGKCTGMFGIALNPSY